MFRKITNNWAEVFQRFFFVLPVLFFITKAISHYSGTYFLSPLLDAGSWFSIVALVLFVFDFLIYYIHSEHTGMNLSRGQEVFSFMAMYAAIMLHFGLDIHIIHWVFMISLYLIWRISIVFSVLDETREYILQYVFLVAVLLSIAYYRWNIFIPLISFEALFLYVINRYGVTAQHRVFHNALYMTIGMLVYIEVTVLIQAIPVSSYLAALFGVLVTYGYVQAARFLPNNNT